ncbi:uncharacterized protein [Phaseolus vulgaris]
MYLDNLTDLSMGYLTNIYRVLHTLNLCRNPFSDEAIAGFLEIVGESLKELVLNNVKKCRKRMSIILFLLSRGQSIKVLSQLLRKARQKNLIIPNVKLVGSEQGIFEGSRDVESVKIFVLEEFEKAAAKALESNKEL